MSDPALPGWQPLLVAFVLAPLLALAALGAVHHVLAGLLLGRPAPVLRAVLRGGRGALRVAVVLLVLDLALPLAPLAPEVAALGETLLGLGLLLALGWSLTRKIAAAFDVQLAGEAPGDDDLAGRRHRTQLAVFRRLAVSAGVALTAGVVLTSIPAVRAVGLSLFASAGVAGIVIGIAARPAVSNLIAGLQIALTQPIRIGDAVQMEGTFGRVQEIGSSFVTILTWDQRSLLVPLSLFVEKPVVNWTRDSAELVDVVLLYLDHAAPVAALRAELLRLLPTLPAWDGRKGTLDVAAMKENCLEVRALVSAADANKLFELRFQVREQLLAWLVREYPAALPGQRPQAQTPQLT